MSLSPEHKALREKYLAALLETVRPMQSGPDAEIALEALIDAAGTLQERLRRELDELRVEQAE